MKKNQSFRTPSRYSPNKPRHNNGFSYNMSQSQKMSNNMNQSNYMSKSLSFAHSSFPIKCNIQSHRQANIHSICLKNVIDKPYRLACLKCMNGHYRDDVDQMVKIQDFLHNENQETLPFQLQNWPTNETGREIRDYIENEEKYIQDLYDGLESYFSDFLEKVTMEVNKIKQNMQQDIAAFYKKGPGKKKIDFINQLKSQYIDSYSLTELQKTIKDLVNRGLQSDIFDHKVEYFINSQTNLEKINKTNYFFEQNKIDARFELDFSHLQDLQKQVTEQIHKCRKITSTSKKQELPKTQASEQISWQDNFHGFLNYMSKQYKQLSEKDIVQYKQEVYADGSKYEGFLVNGHRDIVGSRFYSDGNVYLGEWTRGVKNGNGIFYYYKGNIYEGGFHNDKKEGFGKEFYANGAKYEGEFSGDLKHGNGKYTYQDGKIFEGQYLNDKREGLGVFIYPNGGLEEVLFKEGVKIDNTNNGNNIQEIQHLVQQEQEIQQELQQQQMQLSNNSQQQQQQQQQNSQQYSYQKESSNQDQNVSEQQVFIQQA